MSADSRSAADFDESQISRRTFVYATTFRIVGYLGGIAFLGLGLFVFGDDWQVGLGFVGVAAFCGCSGVALGHYLKRDRTRALRWGSAGFGALGLVILGLTIAVDDGGAGITWRRIAMVAVAAAMIGFPLWTLSRPNTTED